MGSKEVDLKAAKYNADLAQKNFDKVKEAEDRRVAGAEENARYEQAKLESAQEELGRATALRAELAAKESVPLNIADTNEARRRTREDISHFLDDPDPSVVQAVLKNRALKKDPDISNAFMNRVLLMASGLKADTDSQTQRAARDLMRSYLRRAMVNMEEVSSRLKSMGMNDAQIMAFKEQLKEYRSAAQGKK